MSDHARLRPARDVPHTPGRTARATAALAVLALSGGLAACASGTAEEAQDVSGEPQEGGTLVFAQQAEPSCLDPVIGGDMHQATFALQYLDSLVSQDENGDLHPWLATSWEISEDGTDYTFQLKEGVTFHDGVPFDAAAVKANFDRIIDPVRGSGGSAASYLIYVESTEVVDEHTVVVHLGRPFAPFLTLLAQSFVGIQSPKAIERGNDENCKSPVGTGPFVVESYTPGDQAVLVRNESYSSAPPTAQHDGPAHVEKVLWRFIPEGATRYAAVKTGQVHASDGLSPINQVAAEKDPQLDVIYHDYPGYPYGLSFNVSRPPFDDVRVRQAFAHSADVDAGLESIFFGLYERIGTLSHTTPSATDDFVDAYPFDIDRAGELLDEAGWDEVDSEGYRVKDGQRLTVSWIILATPELADMATFAEQIQATAKQAGFEVVIEPLARNEYIERRQSTEFEIVQNKWTLNSPDVLRLLFSIEAIDTVGYRRNAGHVIDEVLDDLVERAAVSPDPQERDELYYQAQQRFSEQAYGIGLYTESVRIVSSTATVHGIRQEPALGLVNLQDAWVTP